MNPALQGYLAAVIETLGEAGTLAEAGQELVAVASLVDQSTELSLALSDGALPVAPRRAVLDDLLAERVRPEVRKLVAEAVTVIPPSELPAALHWLASRVAHELARPAGELPDEEPVLGRLASRNRVAGYAAAVFQALSVDELQEIEDEFFRFARIVESNQALRAAVGGRDLPVAVRQGVVADLLVRASPATRRLAAYTIRGGRARDVVGTFDSLVIEAARARGWRVARVRSAASSDREGRLAMHTCTHTMNA